MLAFDTTGNLGSAAAVRFEPPGRDGATPAGSDAPLPTPVESVREVFEPSRRHSARLLPAIRRVLDRAGISTRRLALTAATRGPGSFTGLRVGLATLQGFALASGVPARGVSSLDAAALADTEDDGAPLRRVSAVDALRGELFVAAYGAGFAPRATAGPHRILPGDLGRWARRHRAARICGPGVARYLDSIAPGTEGIEVRSRPRPLAVAVARLAFARHLRDGNGGDPELDPIYLRSPDIHGR